MLLSMTGFSSKTISLPIDKNGNVSFSIEMKTINSRFFEAVCKLPTILSSLEIKIINILKKKIIRGRVYLTVRTEEEEGLFQNINPSFKLLQGYVKAINKIKKEFNIKGNLTISDVLILPNIFITEKGEITQKDEKKILSVIDQIAEELVKVRAAEGKDLQDDLEKRFTICFQKMNEIKVLSQKLMKEHKEKIKNILALQQRGDDEAKLKLDELYSTLNKIDIHEEITRFNSHIEAVKKVLRDKNVEKGKRIDFIMQELMRESNTVLAKCSNFEISSISVDIKVELEKAREQAQNIV